MTPDVLVVGAGIVGAACAYELAREGLSVEIVDAGRVGGGITAEGMGHLVTLDGSDADVRRWWELAEDLPADCEADRCGTLWVAEDGDGLATLREKAGEYRRHGVACEELDAAALREAEPRLRAGLAGGLRVPGDGVVFPPAVARELVRRATERHGARLRLGTAVRRLGRGTHDAEALLDGGERLRAGWIVDAAGLGALDLLPEPWPGVSIEPRKGHLLVTDRYPGFLRHQVLEVGYQKSAQPRTESSVAFNLQPRPNGRLLLGSSRQYASGREIEAPIVRRMVTRALDFVPDLAGLQVLRVWTGLRAATRDHRPLVGPLPGRPRLLLAAGHEGLGVTLALSTARRLAGEILGRAVS